MKKEDQTNLLFNCKDNYAPLRADGNYNDIINRELLLRSSELYRQKIENASNI